MDFFATTAKGMESLLAGELRALGAEAVEETRAGARFRGDLSTAYRACLESRVANRILLPLRTFPAPTPEKLYGGVKSIRWSDHLSAANTLAVDFSSSRSAITHTHFGALKVKDAIVDQLRSVQGARPSVDVRQPDVRVNVYVHEDEATVSVDLSGDSLHRRGYREEGAPAPLKENLAAAILLLAEWPAVAAAGGAFVDPMCGSGTLPIEAALIADGRAPGLGRQYFGFLRWKGHQPELWNGIVAEARARVEKPAGMLRRAPRVRGYDQDPRSIRAALTNAEQAGLRTRVHFEKRELDDLEIPTVREGVTPKGIVVVNPPYGERLGGEEKHKTLYSRIGDTFKRRFAGWVGYAFTGNPELAKMIGLRASRRHVLFNGALECRLLRFELY
jgi:23S rRNA (guanine2445-N2)-methyltransferase / 23S rRNA (guanine2069-N7)-methyltransferase